jgi:hypothetical protein
LGVLLRFVQLTKYPVGFHIDEASLGYNAYSILKTGKDEWGQVLPLQFKAFGDWPPAGSLYLIAVSETLFGLTELAVRLPSAVFGSLFVVLVYFFAIDFFKKRQDKKKLGIFAAFFTAITPWHLVLSRGSSEDVVANFFVLLASLFLIRKRGNGKRSHLIDKKSFFKTFWLKNSQLFLAFMFFVIASYFYFSARLLAILIISGYFLFLAKGEIFKKGKFLAGKEKKRSFILLILFLFFIALTTYFSKNTRFKTVSIFASLENRLIVEEQIREDGQAGTAVFIARTFHNKLLQLSRSFLTEYGKYMSLDFLILKGGLPERYIIPKTGLIYFSLFVLALLGLGKVLKEIKKKENQFLLWLFITIPFIGALTWENSPNIRRVSFWLVPLVLLMSLGGLVLKKNFKRLWFLIFISLLFEILLFTHQATVHAKFHKPWYRNIGYAEMISFLNKIDEDYNSIYISEFDGDPYIFFLFYNKVKPEVYQQQSFKKPARLAGQNEIKLWEFNNWYFVRQDCPYPREKGTLVIAKGECALQNGFKSVKKFYRPDNSPVFHLYTYKGTDERKQN